MDVSLEFPVINQLIHLNHAAVGPWPRSTADVVKRFADDNAVNGSLHYVDWLQQEKQLRGRLAELINAPSADQIALVKNTSEGLSFVAYGIDWRAGDNIVGIAQDFETLNSASSIWLTMKISNRPYSIYAINTPV